MKKPLLFAIIVLVLGAAGTAFFMMQHAKPKVIPPLPKFIEKLPERTINLSNTNGNPFCRLTVALEISGKGDHAKIIEEKNSALLDAVILTVSKQSYYKLLSIEGKENLKDELLKEFRDILKEDKWEVNEVYLDDIVMEQ
ncbi:MAG: flagellar basal body-associated FliL family protein [bacterium]